MTLHRHPMLETLEERILYSADPGPAGLAAAVIGGTLDLQGNTPAATQGTELVFVDSRSPDRQVLLDDFAAQRAAGRHLEIVVVDASEDGIGLIGRSLQERTDISAVHIVGHGEAGSAQLGASTLDNQVLLRRADEIAAWRDALTPDADLLLYGCSVGAEREGRELVEGLAQLTGADVAASDDLTGNIQGGGDWQLEVQQGRIETASVASDAVQAHWRGLLNTYTVTTTADSGAGSLRQAILDANANSGADSINFAISGTQVHTITLINVLPSITDTVLIDATTDDSFGANGGRPAVVINANGKQTGLSLQASADGSTIRGLVISGYSYAAISIASGSDGNTIVGNYLGDLDASGKQIAGSSTSYVVDIQGANNRIGGVTAADRNVISSVTPNQQVVAVRGTAASGNVISGNYIGTEADGTTAFSNGTTAITIDSGAGSNLIGGSGAGAGNVINAANGLSVYVHSAGSGNVIQGNRIGVSAAGTPFSGDYYGIFLLSSGASILDNWIAGTGTAIWLSGSSGSIVQGNRIGTDLSGTANWGVSRYGLLINGSNNLIGGTGAGQGNIIANSNQAAGAYDGIGISSGTGNVLLGNSIYGTKTAAGSLGIDLADDGVTPNDSGDGDTGVNTLQNSPVLSTARTNGSGQVTVSGSLNSTPGSYFRIEFFANPSAGTNGYGEGRTYLGFLNVVTDASGNSTFSGSFSAVVPSGYVLSATATRSNSTYDAFADTSEFARSITITPFDPDTLVVDTTADVLDGDTTSLATLLANKGADGKVSLREAITATNNTANGSRPDSITFAIPGTGVHTITLSSALPSITDAVSIDATTDDSFVANGGRPAVVIDVNGKAGTGLTLTSTADGSTVRGLVINNYSYAAISIDKGADGNTIVGNYLGALDASGNQRSVIDSVYAIYIEGANNRIGGSTAADRNVISTGGGPSYGLLIYGTGATGNIVSGNYFGTDATGTTMLSTSANLVSIQYGASGNRIGGPSAADSNVIVVSNGLPVYFYQPGSGNVIQGNRIGVSPSGTNFSGGANGILIESGAASVLDNWIAGRNNAIWLKSSSGSVVQGNRIGTDLSGSANWGPDHYGVLIEGSNNLVGGTGAGQGNIIANSNQAAGAYDGIGVLSGTGNALLGNSIYRTRPAAGALGIDLAGEGVTPNDLGDGDTGANGLQNFPVLSGATSSASTSGQLTVSGSLNSSAASAFRIEFFASPSASSSGYGEGQTYLGFVNVTTDAAGGATFSTTLAASVPAGYAITATATGTNAGFSAFSSTSEFSAAVPVQTINTAPVLTPWTPALTSITEDQTSNAGQTVASILGSSVSDADSGALKGMALVATGNGNGFWEYSLDSGASWSAVGGVSSGSALLLRAEDRVRFVPDAKNGTVASLTYRAWDQSSGSAGSKVDASTPGGTSAFSSATDTASLVVTDVNDAPVITSSASASVPENTTAVLTVTATDADLPAQTLSYSIIGGADASKFQIDANTGALSFITPPDFEAPTDVGGNNIYNVTVQVSDGAGGTASQAITVTVTPVNDNLPVITSSATASVPENTTAVLTVTATDADLPAQTLSYSIIGGADASKFQIDANTGALSFITPPDFEAPTDVGGNNIYNVIVQVSDGAGGTASQAITVTVTPVNDGAPVITSSSTASVPENTTAVLTVTATDADQPPQTLTYSIIGGVDAAKFQINASTGELSFITPPDFEAPTDVGGNNIYNVTVQVSDGAGGTASQAITVTVTPVNDNLPVITSSATASVPENTTAVLTVTATDADLPAQTLSYSIIGGADASKFQINASTGELSFITPPDFEAPTDVGGNNIYNVTVQVSDGAGGTASQAITVSVTPVNDNLPVITSSATASVPENTTAVLTVTATDADLPAQTLTYSIVGGADASKFQIDASTGDLSFITPPDFEAPTDVGGDNIYNVTVQVSDGAGGTASQAITVSVTPVNDGAPVITSSSTASVPENTTAVLTVTATDADQPPQTLTYSIIGGVDAAKFQINASTGELSFITPPDFEAPTDVGGNNIYNVTVQVSDGAGGTASQAITVTVTPVNDNLPVITSSATASVPENTTAVLTVTATDADLPAQTLSYSIIGGIDAAKFQINASTGELSFVTPPDFEAPTDVGGNNIYNVTVQVSDGAGGTASQAITVTVTPVNDGAPVITSSSTASAPENTTAVLTVTATDADQPPQTLSYSIVGGVDAAKFQINASTGELSFVTPPDFEAPTDVGGNNIYNVTVQVSDGAGGTASQAITVTVTPVNDNLPVITSSATASVPENTTAVLTVTATDADLPAQTLSYSIIGGVDAAKFQINASTGELSFITPPDFEAPTDVGGNNIYNVTVQVSDGAGGTASQAITVTVTPVNDNLPVITSSATASVPENTTAVLTVTATDADLPAQTLSYSIIGGADASKFQINASTGELSFIAPPDFEAPTDVGGDNIYNVTVQVSDGAGGTASQAITVSVTPVNDNLPVITSSATASVPENTTAVLTVTATDADLPAQTLTYSIIGGADASKFQIDASTGELSFIAPPDFEAPTDVGGDNIYNVTVQVSDGAGGTASQAITVTVTPVNDNLPVITSSATASVPENTTAVLTVTATDADLPAQTLTYSIIGGVDASKFQINASTGELSFITPPDFEAPTDVGGDNIYNVTVQVSDGAGGTASQAITVTVTPVNDNLPVITSSATASVPENTTAVLTVTATDADLPPQTLTYSIVGGVDASKFQINASTGALSFITPPDFEAPTDVGGDNIYNVTVQVSDGAGGTASQALVVVVTNVSDNSPVVSIPGNGGAPGAAGSSPPTTGGTPTPTQPTPPPSQGDKVPPQVGPGGQVMPEVIFPMRPPASAEGREGGVGLPESPVIREGRSSATRSVLGAEGAQVVLTVGLAPTVTLMEFLLSGEQGGSVEDGSGGGHGAIVAGRTPPELSERQGEEALVLEAVSITGLAVSIGTVWWAIRASGLAASVVMSAPVWRSFDPLPVLGPQDEDDPDWSMEEDSAESQNETNGKELFVSVGHRGSLP